MNQEKRMPVRELLFLTLGEAVTSILIIVVYLIIGKFDYTVVTGALLGSLVIVLNFVFLSISVNRALDRALAEVDMKRLTEAVNTLDAGSAEGASENDGDEGDAEDGKSDEIAKLTEHHEKRISNSIRASYLVRTLSMVAALVVALITKQFNIIATAVPLVMQRPLLTISELTKKKEES